MNSDIHPVGPDEVPLQLPLWVDPPAHVEVPENKTRRRRRGFVPVTRDPDVAKSYSDNVALDYAIARGLAQALTSLPAEDLAALRAKVLMAARRNGKISKRLSS